MSIGVEAAVVVLLAVCSPFAWLAGRRLRKTGSWAGVVFLILGLVVCAIVVERMSHPWPKAFMSSAPGALVVAGIACWLTKPARAAK